MLDCTFGFQHDNLQHGKIPTTFIVHFLIIMINMATCCFILFVFFQKVKHTLICLWGNSGRSFRLCLFDCLDVIFGFLFSNTPTFFFFHVTGSVPIKKCFCWSGVFLPDPIVSPATWSSTMTTRKRHGRSSQVSDPLFSLLFTRGILCSYEDGKLFLWMTLTQVNF